MWVRRACRGRGDGVWPQGSRPSQELEASVMARLQCKGSCEGKSTQTLQGGGGRHTPPRGLGHPAAPGTGGGELGRTVGQWRGNCPCARPRPRWTLPRCPLRQERRAADSVVGQGQALNVSLSIFSLFYTSITNHKTVFNVLTNTSNVTKHSKSFPLSETDSTAIFTVPDYGVK